jgi:hypothetical protein
VTDQSGTFNESSKESLQAVSLDPSFSPYDFFHSAVGGQVGGYRYSWQSNGNGVGVQVTNVAGANSFFYHAVGDRTGSTGPFRTITQDFSFNLPIQCGH